MEDGQGWARTGRTAGVEKAKSKVVEVKRLPEKYVNVFHKSTAEKSVIKMLSFYRGAAYLSHFVPFIHVSLLFGIDNSKYFPE